MNRPLKIALHSVRDQYTQAAILDLDSEWACGWVDAGPDGRACLRAGTHTVTVGVDSLPRDASDEAVELVESRACGCWGGRGRGRARGDHITSLILLFLEPFPPRAPPRTCGHLGVSY